MHLRCGYHPRPQREAPAARRGPLREAADAQVAARFGDFSALRLGFAPPMFTGLISDVGTVERVAPRQGGARLTIRPRTLPVDDLALGESVACSGACLTVVERGHGLASFDAVPETLSRTTIGGWREGTQVNLE